MPEFLTPELIELRDRVAAVATDSLVPLRDDATLSAKERRRGTQEASKAAGLYQMTQADQPDSVLALVVARDTLGQHNVGHLPGLFGASPGVLADVGEPLRSEYLLPMLAGDKQAGFAFTEPATAPCRARIDGDELVINGEKSYVTGGADADFLTAVVDVEGRGPAMVVVDTDAKGVTLARRFSSFDGSHHAAFTFADVRVPVSQIAGAPGQGLSRAMSKISEVRLSIAANCVGTAAWVIDHVTEQLRRPRRGGPSLAERESVRLRYGDMRIKAFMARSAVYRTARLADRGENVVNECIACKVFAAETVGELVDAAVQMEGGEALVEGHPLEAVLRRVRTLRLAEGESDVLRLNLARGWLDLGMGRL